VKSVNVILFDDSAFIAALVAKTGLLDDRRATSNKIAFDWVAAARRAEPDSSRCPLGQYSRSLGSRNQPAHRRASPHVSFC